MEVRLGGSADGANPVFGKIGKGGAGSDAAVGIAGGGIIFVAANIANVFLHDLILLPARIAAAVRQGWFEVEQKGSASPLQTKKNAFVKMRSSAYALHKPCRLQYSRVETT